MWVRFVEISSICLAAEFSSVDLGGKIRSNSDLCELTLKHRPELNMMVPSMFKKIEALTTVKC